MTRHTSSTLTLLVVLLCSVASSAWGNLAEVLNELNNDKQTVKGNEESKSYKVLFDAYLDLDEPPMALDEFFNQNTIHPGMADWSTVVGWAESNPKMAQAILESREKIMIGLPYGLEQVPQSYRDAGLVAEVSAEKNILSIDFPYLNALDVISTYVVVESYRLCEAGKTKEALDLSIAHVYLLRQFCDRQFLDEKMNSIILLVDALRNLRDLFYVYMDKITTDEFVNISWNEMPYLNCDRNHLFMPEGDKVVSEALIKSVFTDDGANQELFASTFAAIQSADAPLTRFGAARRWMRIALVHDSLQSSLDRLQLVYDDWWRRWRVQEYDPILDFPSEFDITNPIRYAAVIYSMQNIEELFNIRNLLVAEINGTAISAALCAYHKTFNAYPDATEKTYGQFLRRNISDIDPFEYSFGFVRYRRLDERKPLDTSAGRLWLETGQGVLWVLGQDHENNWAELHTGDGAEGDIVIWPPIKSISREQGLLN